MKIPVKITDSAKGYLTDALTSNNKKYVHLSVSGGGCSGFQYNWNFIDEDKDGKLKIKKGKDLIDSGFKVTQTKHLSKDYANSPAFMNFQEDKANNFVTTQGIQLTNLNPVMGSSGTNLFGILGDKIV